MDQSDDGKQVDLAIGQVLEIRLKENPTTGFRWTAAPAAGHLCVAVSDALHGGQASASMGAAGERVWQVRAVQAGECDVSLELRRSFDAPGPAAATFTAHIRVTPPAT